jgi:hypothetical protein
MGKQCFSNKRLIFSQPLETGCVTRVAALVTAVHGNGSEGPCHASKTLLFALSPGSRCGHGRRHDRDSSVAELLDSERPSLEAAMPASSWMRKWRGAQSGGAWASALARAALRDEPLSQLLELGARALLATGGADRAGLWLAGERRGEASSGCVLEAVPGPTPEQWKRLDIETPFLRAALDSPNPLHVDFSPGKATPPHMGPLVGLRSAIWIPLRAREHTFGLAMVGRGARGER